MPPEGQLLRRPFRPAAGARYMSAAPPSPVGNSTGSSAGRAVWPGQEAAWLLEEKVVVWDEKRVAGPFRQVSVVQTGVIGVSRAIQHPYCPLLVYFCFVPSAAVCEVNHNSTSVLLDLFGCLTYLLVSPLPVLKVRLCITKFNFAS